MAGLVNPPPRSPSLPPSIPSLLRSAEALTKPPKHRLDSFLFFVAGKTQNPAPPEEEQNDVVGGCGVRDMSGISINRSFERSEVRVRGGALLSVRIQSCEEDEGSGPFVYLTEWTWKSSWRCCGRRICDRGWADGEKMRMVEELGPTGPTSFVMYLFRMLVNMACIRKKIWAAKGTEPRGIG